MDEGEVTFFDGTGSSDPDGDALTYSWDFGDGETATGATPTHTYADNGAFTVSLTVDDGNGGVDTDSLFVNVNNVAPEIVSMTLSSSSIDEGQSVTVSGNFLDPGTLDTHTVLFDWGDGSTKTLHLNSTSDVLAFYPFDGNANDTSGNGNDGIVSGATLTAGFEGSGYFFDGTDDFITAGVDINPSVHPQLTMGAWVNAASSAPIRQVISHDDGGFDRSLGIDSRGGGTGWSAFSGTGNVLGFEPVVNDEWVFVSVVYDQDADSVTLYVDEQVFNEPGTLGPGHDFIRIGSNPDFGEFFHGTIDNVFILESALSADEIAFIRENGASAITARLGDVNPGDRDFSATHTYKDDNPTATSSDVYTITATVTDDDGGSDSANTTLTVNNVAPTLTSLTVTSPINENGFATLSGTFSDPGGPPVSNDFLLTNLAGVDGMIDGTLPSSKVTGQIAQADILGNDVPGNWAFNHSPPGGGGNDYAIVGTGTLQVNTAGDFSFALSGDDGGRLRIDLNQDGDLDDAGETIIVDNTTHPFQNFFNSSVHLTLGAHAFEWIGFERGGRDSWELSVNPDSGKSAPVDTANGWKVVGDPSPHAEIELLGMINVDAYYTGGQDTHEVTIDWKDGTVETLAVPVGATSFTVMHQYLDDNPTATSSDIYGVTAFVTDDDGGASATLSADVTVNNVPPVIPGTGTTLVYSNDFDAAPIVAGGVTASLALNGGSSQSVQNFSTLGAGFAGSFLRNDSGGNPAGQTTLTLTGLPAHTSVDLDFLVAIIDSWDGSFTSVAPDLFNVKVDGNLLFSETFDIFDLSDQSYTPPAGGLLTLFPFSNLGFNSGWNDAAYDMGLESAFDDIPHASSTLAISWYASGAGWQAGNDESWAIENVAVTLGGTGAGLISLDATVIDEGGSVTVTGSFIDVGTQDTHSVLIDWGGNETPSMAVVIQGAGGGTFTATHQYKDDDPTNTASDVYTITATLTDDDGGSDSASTTLTVNNVDPKFVAAEEPYAFDVVENSPAATVVGDVNATDVGTLDTLTYSITGITSDAVSGPLGDPDGDTNAPFVIDASTGEITVNDADDLDFENVTQFTLTVLVTDDDGGTDTTTVTVNVLNEANITGFVFADVDNDGVFDVEDAPLANVEITLVEAGVDAVFGTADDETFMTTTDNDGFYGFEDVAAGKVRIIESGAPADLVDGIDTPDGVIDLDAVNDQFTIDFARTDVNGMNFAEQADAGGLSSGDTATIGFWQNKHGQALIDELDETGELTLWLLDNFGNIFDQDDFDEHGGSVGKFYRDEFFKKKLKGTPKVDAQFMAVAFAAFATSSNLSNGGAVDFGFNVTDSGIGSTVVNVGDSGAAFGVADNTDMTIMALLLVTNSLTAAGADLIYDDGDNILTDSEKTLRVMANVIYTDINEGGDI